MKVTKTPTREGVTLAERADIVKEALRLIRKPESWVRGEWKCPLYTDGEVVVPRTQVAPYQLDTEFHPLTDKAGNPQHAYCVEGAINQAAVNVLGTDRALKVGVGGASLNGGIVTEMVSVNQFLRDLPEEGNGRGRRFHDVWIGDTYRPAQDLNDRGNHEAVLAVLRARLRQLRTQLRKGGK